MAREMNVVPYDVNWSALYELEKNILTKVFGSVILDIQHFGSTSIVGMTAKPIIDVMVVVEKIELIDDFNEAMIAEDYSVRGENGIPRRRYFVRLKEDKENHAAHIHIYERGNPHITDELMFRDFLRIDKESFEKYEKVKKEAAVKFRFSPKEYVDAKSDCVMEIMERARQHFRIV